jgi:phospholipid/cholesterol/gamma-HCH transport system substrate-binding protein
MNESRIELKVGFFVAVGLALLALLVLSFSRGTTLFERTYKLTIVLPSAAGLKPTADVMMSGVPIGKTTDLQLAQDGLSVAISVRIVSKYQIRTNAVFHIDALGFLGDQYVAVTPSTNLDAPFWQDGNVVKGESPFNMQEAVRSVSGLLEQAKVTVIDIDQTIRNIDRTVLSDQSLSNISLALSNAEAVTKSVRLLAQGAEDLLHSNTPAVNSAVTNLLGFSERLKQAAGNLDVLVSSNGPAVDETIRNLRETSVSIKQVAADLEAGKGVIGGLLKDDEMKAQTAMLISNASAMSAAFGTFGSNLNQNGIWRMLWKPKHTERSEKSPSSAP